MIHFFRRIRRKLLNQERVGKYLIYAVGEILLVVIGILIALQVNNWNQERISRDKEKVYLKEIRASLEKDLADQNRVFDFNGKKIALILQIISEMGKDKSKTEHMLYLFGLLNKEPEGSLVNYDVFIPNRAAFDNMLSSENIGIVQDDELRSKLSEYYRGEIVDTGTQERVKQIVRKFSDLITRLGVNKESMRAMMNMETNYPSAEEMDPINGPEIMGQIFLMMKNVESQNVWLEEVQENTQFLIQNIDQYLGQLTTTIPVNPNT
ncbi:DUF6090 family protein [Aureitalea marina]|uniref:Uncharacterized protein n=1 Tax=Aureitalea marina TaxID=930804 RepID=A0A2S7KSG8_9FLAO|nr:DUF6090 family protein [Aureitalea marina]PQB05571.1 hypothetical protein BST85_12180 [Aureitalea marina]